jgi:hypothetical protein
MFSNSRAPVPSGRATIKHMRLCAVSTAQRELHVSDVTVGDGARGNDPPADACTLVS